MNEQSFLLLQINDAAFPIGAFTHSFGLETYILKGLVANAEQAHDFIEQNLIGSFLYSELLPAKRAFEFALNKDIEALTDFEDLLFAARFPREMREAATKLGGRFAKTVALIGGNTEFFERYCEAVGEHISRPVAYGVYCAGQGIALDETLAAYLFAQTSGMVTNCVKTVPLSQSDGQRILGAMRPIYEKILAQLEDLSDADLMRSCPGLEARSMQHERLYSRMYIS